MEEDTRLRGRGGGKGFRTGCESAGLDLDLGFTAAAFGAGGKSGGAPRLRLIFVTFAKGNMVKWRK